MSEGDQITGATSRAGVKQQIGRDSVRSANSYHEGRSAAHKTELNASDRLARSMPKEKVTDIEWQEIQKSNPSDVKSYLSAGMTKQQIFDTINKQEIN